MNSSPITRSFAFLLIFCFVTIGSFAQSGLVILLSKSYGNNTYEDWVKRQSPGTKTVSMYHLPKDSVEYWLKTADGFLLTGGEDIYPGRYGKEMDTARCDKPFDLHRDSLEWKMLDAAKKQNKPVFGICRGFQMLNVYSGGTLYIDIPTALGKAVTHRDGGPTNHLVEVKRNTTLSTLSQTKGGEIKSNHHQGVDKLGKNLTPMATSADGLIEAMEVSDKKRFAMAVQWHPERMPENDPLSAPLAKAFIKACQKDKK